MTSLIQREDFDPNRYYTHAGMGLFIIALVIKPGLLKTTLLLNSVFIGLIGNLVLLKNYSTWIQTSSGEDMLMKNFIMHTLPMFLSFLVLFGCPPKRGETSKIIALLSALFLLWAAIPRQGMGMSQKVYDSYRITVGVIIITASLLTASTCKAIEYFRG